jgi:hypothetical protein
MLGATHWFMSKGSFVASSDTLKGAKCVAPGAKRPNLELLALIHLDTVVAAFSDGATAEEIAQQYPSLNLADVYYVIGYYVRRPSQVEAYLQQRKAQIEDMRKQNGSRFDPQGVRDRLLARRASKGQ